MKISSIVKSLATVAAFAASGILHAQPFSISGGWDRELPPNPVTAGHIDISQDTLYGYACLLTLRSISLTVNNPGGFSAFGQTFSSSGSGPTWSKSFPVDEPNGVCGLLPDDLEPFGPLGGSSGLSGNWRVIYNWGESAAGCGSDTTPAVSLSAGSGTASPNDWSCAQLMVVGYMDLDTYFSFTPLSINLVVHGIDGNINNWLNYDLY